jgi:hypothetical protein
MIISRNFAFRALFVRNFVASLHAGEKSSVRGCAPDSRGATPPDCPSLNTSELETKIVYFLNTPHTCVQRIMNQLYSILQIDSFF